MRADASGHKAWDDDDKEKQRDRHRKQILEQSINQAKEHNFSSTRAKAEIFFARFVTDESGKQDFDFRNMRLGDFK